MAEQIKDLGGVVNRDVAFSKVKEDLLYDSENFRITTDEGGTLAVRTNIKGNSFILSIPDTQAEVEIILLDTLVIGEVYQIDFTVTNSTTLVTSTVTLYCTYTSIESFYNSLKTSLLPYTTNPSNALYGAEVLLTLNFTKLIVRGDLENLVSVSMTALGTSTDVSSSLFLEIVREPQSALKIIGWCTIRDTIYLLTTNGTFNPDIDPAPYVSLGQWWRLDYDKSLSPADPSHYILKLVYNNFMNVTIQRPVANPGMIEGRYENENIQKIYWTDNFNVPRQINVAPSRDAITAALTVDQLNLLPALNMELPRIVEIGSGSLYAGVYFVIYRLKNLNGSETRFSRPSQPFPIIDATEGASTLSMGYYPNAIVDSTTGVVTGKSMRVRIDNINTEYSTIELATIWYKNNVDLPEIRVVKELSIPANGKIDTFITGAEDKVVITLDEATAFTTAIRRCKTLAAKKQTLFLGNLTIASQKVDFDTRVYRFPLMSATTEIKDASGNIYTIDSTQDFKITEINGSAVTPYDVPEDYDCIQDYTSQDPGSDQNFLYLPSSDILGGEGPNMKYVFVTGNNSLILDRKYVSAPFAATGPFIEVDYNQQTSFDSLSTTAFLAEGFSYTSYLSPFNYGIYEGYTRDEMYRFGVVFYDPLDNPTFVNWTADIRMPAIYMPDTTAGARYSGGGKPLSTIFYTHSNGQVFDSRITNYSSTTRTLTANPLGVQFTFKSTPSSFYKTASIVRMERTFADKHVIGQGLLRQGYTASACWARASDHIFLSPVRPRDNADSFESGDSTSAAEGNVWSFHSPETVRFKDPLGNELNESKLGPLGVNDKIEIVSIFKSVEANWLEWFDASSSYFPANGGYGDTFDPPGTACGDKTIDYYASYDKMYEFIEDASRPYVIKGYSGNTNNPYLIVKTVDTDTRYWTAKDTIFSTSVSASRKVIGSTPTAFPVDPPAWRYGTPCDGQHSNPGQFSNNNNSHVMSALGRCTIVELDFNNVFPDFNNAGSRQMLYRDNIWDANAVRHYVANYKRFPSLIYNGNTYFARSLNEYISCGNFVDLGSVGSLDTVVFGGDTVIEIFDKVLDHYNNGEHQAIKNAGASFSPGPKWNISGSFFCQYPADGVKNVMRWAMFPVETSMPISYRRIREGYSAQPFGDGNGVPNKMSYLVGNPDGNLGTDRIENAEYMGLDPVYIHNSKSIYRYFVYNPAIIPTETFDCRVWRSENKIDGENLESWSIYKPGAFKDVESAYGPLNNLIVFQDKLYFIQDRGFGTLQVDEQKLITDAQGESDLVLGSTGLLERYDYISTKTGTKHQFSMSVSDYSMVWFDTMARKLIKYKPGALEPISDIKGYHAFLYQETDGIIQTDDNPYIFQGVHSTYDYRYHEFYFTFVQPSNILRDGRTMAPNPFTLVYNELFEGFVGKYTHHPVVYINDKSNIFSVPSTIDNPLDPSSLYVHNYGDYGVFYGQAPAQSKISFVINSNPSVEKVLNNLEVSAEVFDTTKILFNQPVMYDFFDTIRVYDNYQNSDYRILLPTLARKHKTIWNIKVPSDRVLDVNQPIFDTTNLSTLRPPITKRFKDKWFVVDLVYNNEDNYKIVAHNAKAIFTVNSR